MYTEPKQNTKKNMKNTLSIRGLIFPITIAVGFIVMLVIRQHGNIKSEATIVAYNERSAHIVGSSNYENPTFSCWKQILALEHITFRSGLTIQRLYDEGFRAVTISYKDVWDNTSNKMYQAYPMPFQFDESGLNSVEENNGWVTERYNLVMLNK